MTGPAQRLADTQVWALLQSAQKTIGPDPVTASDLERLGRILRREGVDPETVAAITSQLGLRVEALPKFGESAQHMLLTRTGMEQATRFPVSFLHALRFKDAGVTAVADLGCGIGADAVAMAETGMSVVALDRDPEAVACAAVNLRDFPGSQAILGDISDVTPAWLAGKTVNGIFLDPARREGTKRLLNPEQWSPSWSRVKEIFSWGYPTGAKLAPGIDHAQLSFGSHAQWTSVDGELVEAALWSDQLSPEGPGRSAQLFSRGKLHVLRDPETESANAPVRPAPTGPVGRYIFEPDSSAIRAGALSHLAELTATHLVHPRIAYMTGDSPSSSSFLRGFQVEDVVPLRQKRILSALRNMDAGSVEVKKRGANIDPSAWQRELQKKLKGGRPLAVLATRTDNGHVAIIASRLRPAELEGEDDA